MTTLRALNCGLEILCVLICLILLIQEQTAKTKRDTDHWFRLALISAIGVLLGDIVDWGLTGTAYPLAHALMVAANTVYFLSSTLYMFSIFGYVYAYMNSKRPQPKVLLNICKVLLGLQALLVLSTPFTGAIFYISADNLYVRGPLWILTQLPPVMTYLMTLLVYARSWRTLSRKERLCFSMYFSFNCFGEVMQNCFSGVAMLSVMFTLTLLLISMFIHTEMDEQLHNSEQQLERERIQSLQALQRKQAELTAEIITALSNAVEAKDRYTNGHSRRVAAYAREIVRRMGWSREEQEKVYYTGLLHDVGKIRVMDSIINKSSRLDDDEFAQIKLHTMAGYYILKEISSVGEFAIGARWHHERYDGRGYPNGLYGENIPLIARVISVADAYDAMTSNRSYREIMPQSQARRQIEEGSGSQFDPKIAAIMLKMIDEDTDYQLRQPNMAVERVILAIDDDSMVHKLLKLIFRSQPLYRLRTAVGGREGLEILQREPVDLVLLDVEMSGINGFEVLRIIREKHGSLPVIFMTGDKEIDIIQKAEKLGVSDYLSKPLVAHILMESVENVLLNTKTMQQADGKGGRPPLSAPEA